MGLLSFLKGWFLPIPNESVPQPGRPQSASTAPVPARPLPPPWLPSPIHQPEIIRSLGGGILPPVPRARAPAYPPAPSSNSTLVPRAEKPLWECRKWLKRGNFFTGYYRTRFGSWRGEIQNLPSGILVWVFNPPEEVFSGHFAPCFAFQGDGKYEVHFRIKPISVDVAIVGVEQAIKESFA